MKTISAKSFRQKPETLLGQLKKQKTALLVDADGLPAAYLVDPAAFDGLHARIRLLEGIARGERAIREGRTFTHTQAKKKLGRWLKK
jgi:hypothetical protein